MLFSRSLRLLIRFQATFCLLLMLFILGCGCESSTSSNRYAKKGLSGIVLKNGPLAIKGEETSSSIPEVGSISGKLLYRADAERPWLSGKHYLKNSTEGELATAVVCLSSKHLRKTNQENQQPKTWIINQKHHQFSPEVLAIQVGDSVTFKNSDQVTHNVNAQSPFDSFNFMTPIADSETHLFMKAGNEQTSVKIRCNLHSQMYSQIYVFDHPFHQVTDAKGQFEFHNVPAGEYELVVIHTGGTLQSHDKISVTENQILMIEKTISADDLLKPSYD